ncbi:hypothetical protein ACVFI8_21545 [Agarivorans sp. MS3-6]
MSYCFIILGGLIVVYTLLAYITGLPQLTDLIPVCLGSDHPSEQFYKVVPSDKPDHGPKYILGLGVAILVAGLGIKYLLSH